ncbi:uncharacterized protein LOC127257175 [Andrographis paniculata]|uniref:uncharacterized protein LOC127257175 n=1 Tax=Andrographis paniculata TaxID=175694 RepID=UPI0021E6FA28|nr:uncharacterized protein LOC127257175 [Andrographis paniculata]
MASAAAPPPLTFLALSASSPPPPPPQMLPVKPLLRPVLLLRPIALIRSVDVSKEDQPTAEAEEESPEQQLEQRRVEEKFAVVNTGIHECRSCGFRYNQAVGDPSYPIPAGMPFERLPDDWRCPTCGASQSFFESKRVEIAGFEQNQQYGFGGNSLTSGQKALLIYGGLILGFVFFLSGYFLQ